MSALTTGESPRGSTRDCTASALHFINKPLVGLQTAQPVTSLTIWRRIAAAVRVPAAPPAAVAPCNTPTHGHITCTCTCNGESTYQFQLCLSSQSHTIKRFSACVAFQA